MYFLYFSRNWETTRRGGQRTPCRPRPAAADVSQESRVQRQITTTIAIVCSTTYDGQSIDRSDETGYNPIIPWKRGSPVGRSGGRKEGNDEQTLKAAKGTQHSRNTAAAATAAGRRTGGKLRKHAPMRKKVLEL